MAYVEYQTPQGALGYNIKEDGVVLTAYRGKDISIEVPKQIEGKNVIGIEKKTFLSAKSLKELILPEEITFIKDFAFAFCSNLVSIHMPKHLDEMGIGLFKDCHALKEIYLPHFGETQIASDTAKEQAKMDLACLLAATVGILDAPYLFDFKNAGTTGWLKHWDMRMMTIMNIDDMEGYSKLLLCGEEDYGSNENNVDLYVENNRKAKCRLAMLRLLHDYGLDEDKKEFLADYLRNHTKGQVSEETWKVVLEEHGDEKNYYELLLNLSCIQKENIAEILDDMGDKHAEMKVFLLRYQDEFWNDTDFFDDLEL